VTKFDGSLISSLNMLEIPLESIECMLFRYRKLPFFSWSHVNGNAEIVTCGTQVYAFA